MKAIRERILNVRIGNFTTTTYLVPKGYSVDAAVLTVETVGATGAKCAYNNDESNVME